MELVYHYCFDQNQSVWINCTTSDDGNKWDNIIEITNIYVALILGTFCLFAFPLNLEIGLKIVYDKTMRRTPRYVIQLFTTLSNLLTLVMNALQIVHYATKPNEGALCRFLVLIFGWSYATFLFNLFLSLIDICVALVLPFWHRRQVTRRRLVCGLIGLNLSLAVVVKWPFIGRVLPLSCVIESLHATTIQETGIFLFSSCFVFLFIDFILICLSTDRAAGPAEEEIEMDSLPGGHHPSPTAISLRQEEVESSKWFLIGLIPIFFFLPLLLFIIYSSHRHVCLRSYPAPICDDLTWTVIPHYVLVVINAHALINPIMILWLNKDFAPPRALSQFYCLFKFSAQNDDTQFDVQFN